MKPYPRYSQLRLATVLLGITLIALSSIVPMRLKNQIQIDMTCVTASDRFSKSALVSSPTFFQFLLAGAFSMTF